MKGCAAWSFALCVALAAAPAAAAGRMDASLTSVGSDTSSILLARWAAGFRAMHPQARIQIQAAGSASAPIALIQGAADIGAMSRPMNARELADFSARFGHAPMQLVVAHDAIVVFVHPDNPLARITLAQIDAIYSAKRTCGAAQPIRRWRDLGIDGPLGERAILAIGRNASSGTHEMFRELALCNGDYRPQVVAWPGNGAVVAAVAQNHEALGYAGIGYVNGLVKPLAIVDNAGQTAVAPDLANIAAGRYPLERALYVYVNQAPDRPLAHLPAAFLAYALSDEGQALVGVEGFVALTAQERRAQRAILDR